MPKLRRDPIFIPKVNPEQARPCQNATRDSSPCRRMVRAVDVARYGYRFCTECRKKMEHVTDGW